MFEHYFGPVPAGHVVRHTCDNPPCFKKDHLISGTHKDNMDDKYSRNRAVHPKSTEHPCAKLTDEEYTEIRRLATTRELRQVDIAARFGIAQSAVSRIKAGGML